MHTCTCIFVYMRAYVRIYACTHIRSYAPMHVRMYAHACKHACVRAQWFTRDYTYPYDGFETHILLYDLCNVLHLPLA